jgi:hypothetical protein
MYVERFIDGRWCLEKNPELCSDYGSVYSGRSYSLFSILAGVRDYYGMQSISEPKGLPADVSEAVRGESDDYGCDGHSHSHLTLAELLAFNWDQTATVKGYVQLGNYGRWKASEELFPDSWCQGTSGEIVSNEQADRLLANPDLTRGSFTYTHCEWEVPYRELDGGFLDIVENKLRPLGDPEHVRIVFWFDN